MSLWRRGWNWLRDVCRLSRVEHEMDLELRSHVEAYTHDLISAGMSPEEARRRARIDFGSFEQTKDDCRNARGINVVETVSQDLRFALRIQRRSWSFAAVAVPTLALGIGTAAAIFSVVKAVIFNPLPFHEPANLVHIWEGHGHYQRGDEAYFSSARPAALYNWRSQSHSFENITAYRWRLLLLTDNKQAELVSGQDVYDEFFEILGTAAYRGRTLQASDYAANSPHVTVISYAMWTKRLGADPAVIGRQIFLDRESYEIVGVMPPGFFPASAGRYPELWTPHWANEAEKEDLKTWGLFPLARLKSGVTWQHAQTELDLISARMLQDHPDSDIAGGIVVPMDAQLIGSSWKLLLLLAVAVGMLFLVACVNVANLLLARAVDREREFAIRTALGARRTRIVLQLFTESMVFSLAAGMLAVGVAAAADRGLLAVLPRVAILSRLDSVKVDFGMLAFTGSLTLLVSLAFCFIPLLRISSNGEYDALKNEGRVFSATKSKRWLRQLFVVSEFVFSLVLLILGVLLTRSFVKLQHTRPGFNANNLLTFRVIAPEVNYGKFTWGEKDPRREKLYEKIEQVLTEVPGVESVALAANLPLAQNFNASPVLVTGRAPQPKATRPNFSEEQSTGTQMVNPQYFRTLGVKLVSGRFFEEHDREGTSRVAIVNEAFARKFLPKEDPLGHEVTVWFAKTIIVGVVADFKIISLDRNPVPEIFWCMRQASPPNVWILTKGNSDPAALGETLRRKIQDVDPDLPVQEMQPMQDVIADSLSLKRVSATLIGLVAVLAIFLAGAGIYSIVSYSVRQRRKEMGIRIAFGANRNDVAGLVVGEACRLGVIGSILGCAIAAMIGKLATHTVYISPEQASSLTPESLSPAAFIASALFLLVLAIAASYAPARDLLQTDPLLALRDE